MELTQASLDIIFRQAELKFGQALAATPTWYEKIATVFPTTTRQVDYGWMARIPTMRKWIGDRQLQAIATHVRSVINEPYEDTLALEARDVRDDQFGLFNMALTYLTGTAAKQPDYMIADAIRAASVTLGYDGKAVYATDHPTNGGPGGTLVSGTQSNLFLNTALTYDNYVTVKKGMRGFQGEDGKPLAIKSNLLVVPPALEEMGKLILQADFLANINAVATAPQTNIQKGTAELLVIEELNDQPNNWWLLDTTKIVKPWMYQTRQAPRFTYLTNPTDANVFMRNQFLYGVDLEGAAAETLWFLSAAATSEAAYVHS